MPDLDHAPRRSRREAQSSRSSRNRPSLSDIPAPQARRSSRSFESARRTLLDDEDPQRDCTGIRILSANLRPLYQPTITLTGAPGIVNNSVVLCGEWLRNAMRERPFAFGIERLARPAEQRLEDIFRAETLNQLAWQMTPFLRSNLSNHFTINFGFADVEFERVSIPSEHATHRIYSLIDRRLLADNLNSMLICTLVDANNRNGYGFSVVASGSAFYTFNPDGNYTTTSNEALREDGALRTLQNLIGHEVFESYAGGCLVIYKIHEQPRPENQIKRA